MKTACIIRTGTTFKKIPCCMRNSACWWRIVKNAKILKLSETFLKSPACEKLENLAWSVQISFHEATNRVS